jgi:hypothetical protein
MSKYYKGKFRPQNIAKYRGDFSNIVYRSLWERQVFKWCDINPNVKSWSSEEVVIAYRCRTDGKMHRYYVDMLIEFVTGQKYLIEIKPKKQTIAPQPKKIKTQKYLTEVMTYAKNLSKWEAAQSYCEERGMIFEVWHEDILKALGIRLLT